jgi:hypothetical protein
MYQPTFHSLVYERLVGIFKITENERQVGIFKITENERLVGTFKITENKNACRYI